jgi:hypothetical protein
MKQFTIFLFLLMCGFAEAQNTVYESSKDALNFGAAKVSRNGSILYGFDNEPVELEGSSYADSTWKQGSFIFYPTEKGVNKKSDTVHGFTLRYDVHKAEVDILHKNKCFAATTDMLKGVLIKAKTSSVKLPQSSENYNIVFTNAAKTPPIIGPTTGIQA